MTQTPGTVWPLTAPPSCPNPPPHPIPIPRHLLRPPTLPSGSHPLACPGVPLSDSDHDPWPGFSILTPCLIPACPTFRPVSPRPLLSVRTRSRSSLRPCLPKGSTEQEKGQAPGPQTQWDQSLRSGRGHGAPRKGLPHAQQAPWVSVWTERGRQRERCRDEVLRVGAGASGGLPGGGGSRAGPWRTGKGLDRGRRWGRNSRQREEQAQRLSGGQLGVGGAGKGTGRLKV